MALIPLNLGGDAYALGLGLGEFGRDAVHRHLRPLALWRFLTQQIGTPKATAMRGLVEAQFPAYWAELRGLADGLQLPLDEVFLWNCRGDYVHPDSVDGCTTVMSPTASGVLIAHNEDGFPALRGHCGLLQARPETGLGFMSFVYPGSLPGHTFALNASGVAITVNNIRPTEIPPGIPRQILGRAALDAKSLDEAVQVLTQSGRAGAFHHAVAQLGSTRLVSVEATAAGAQVTEVGQAMAHSNHLIGARLGSVAQRITGSSGARQACVDRLTAGLGAVIEPRQALAILRDTSDAQLPVYRCAPDDPDDENTLATALFEIAADRVDWAVFCEESVDVAEMRGSVSPHRPLE